MSRSKHASRPMTARHTHVPNSQMAVQVLDRGAVLRILNIPDNRPTTLAANDRLPPDEAIVRTPLTQSEVIDISVRATLAVVQAMPTASFDAVEEFVAGGVLVLATLGRTGSHQVALQGVIESALRFLRQEMLPVSQRSKVFELGLFSKISR